MHYQYILLLTLLSIIYQNTFGDNTGTEEATSIELDSMISSEEEEFFDIFDEEISKEEEKRLFNNDYLMFQQKFQAFDENFLETDIRNYQKRNKEYVNEFHRKEMKKWIRDPAHKSKLLTFLCVAADDVKNLDASRLGQNIWNMLQRIQNFENPTNDLIEYDPKDHSFDEYFTSCFKSKKRPPAIENWFKEHNAVTVSNDQFTKQDDYALNSLRNLFSTKPNWWDNFCDENIKSTPFRNLAYQLIIDALILPSKEKFERITENKQKFLCWRYFFLLRITFRYFFDTINIKPERHLAMIDFEFEHYYDSSVVVKQLEGDEQYKSELMNAFSKILLTYNNLTRICKQHGGKKIITEMIAHFSNFTPRLSINFHRLTDYVCEINKNEKPQKSYKIEINSEYYRSMIKNMPDEYDADHFFQLFHSDETKPDKVTVKIIFYYTVFKIYQDRNQFARHVDGKYISEVKFLHPLTPAVTNPETSQQIRTTSNPQTATESETPNEEPEISTENELETNDPNTELEDKPGKSLTNQQTTNAEDSPETSPKATIEEASSNSKNVQNPTLPLNSKSGNTIWKRKKFWFKCGVGAVLIISSLVVFFFSSSTARNYITNLSWYPFKNATPTVTPETDNTHSALVHIGVVTLIVIVIVIIGLSYYLYRQNPASGKAVSKDLEKDMKDKDEKNDKKPVENVIVAPYQFTSAFCSRVPSNEQKKAPYKSDEAHKSVPMNKMLDYGESKF